ncbi:hypothetical protein JCM11491_003439 [Sporobolomyces phaffii]
MPSLKSLARKLIKLPRETADPSTPDPPDERLSHAEPNPPKLIPRPPQYGPYGPGWPDGSVPPPFPRTVSAPQPTTTTTTTEPDESSDGLWPSRRHVVAAARAGLRDPRFPSPPRHHSSDAIPRARVPPTDSDRAPYVRPALVAAYADLYTPAYDHSAHLVAALNTFATDLSHALDEAEPRLDYGAPRTHVSGLPWETSRVLRAGPRVGGKTMAPYTTTNNQESGEGAYERAQRARKHKVAEKARIKAGVPSYPAPE